MEKDNEHIINKINYEKISVYFTLLVGFLTLISYIVDMKERIAKLEVRVEFLQSANLYKAQPNSTIPGDSLSTANSSNKAE